MDLFIVARWDQSQRDSLLSISANCKMGDYLNTAHQQSFAVKA